MKIRDLIRDKGFEVIAVDGTLTMADAIRKMVDRNVGAILVVEAGQTAGIVTERDVLKCWAKGLDFEKAKLADVMTRNLLVADVDDEIDYASTIMIQNRIRHLPVLEKGRLVSVLSIRDVVKAQVGRLQAEVHYLKDFIADIG